MVTALAVLAAAGPAAAAQPSAGCDPLDGARCLFPWPNDYFTRADPTSPTGRRLALTTDMMPRNQAGVPIAPGDYNWSDGFSPGQTIVTKVPGLDTPEALRRTGAVPVTDLARTYDRRQPVVVIDANTGRRHLIWAELDSTATTAANTALLIHPAVNFREGHVGTSWLSGDCATRTARSSPPRAPSGSTETGSPPAPRPSNAAGRTWSASSRR